MGAFKIVLGAVTTIILVVLSVYPIPSNCFSWESSTSTTAEPQRVPSRTYLGHIDRSWFDGTSQNRPPFFGAEDQRSSLGRIIAGRAATPCLIPYQVAMLIFTCNGTYLCGGSLVSNSHVLTAAHCCDYKEYNCTSQDDISFLIILGSLTVFPPYDTTTTQIRDAILLGLHPDWNRSLIACDFAMLQLSVPVDFTDCVGLIHLACDKHYPSDDDCVTVSGYGRDNPLNASSIALYLKYVCIRYWSKDDCALAWPSNFNAKCMICAGSIIEGTCNGDSGGPLVFFCRLIGTVSFGIINCVGPPTVFARVSAGCRWFNCITGGYVKCDCKEERNVSCQDACTDVGLGKNITTLCPPITTTATTTTRPTNMKASLLSEKHGGIGGSDSDWIDHDEWEDDN